VSNVLVIGATSAIAEATARLFAERGDRLFLVGRNTNRLAVIAEDLRIRGAGYAGYESVDLNDIDQHKSLLDKIYGELDEINIALISYGTLSDQTACEETFSQALKEFNTNAISVLSLLTNLANRFEQQGKGTLAVISSPAGDRGRQSNYVYGAAKGAVSLFMEGLRNRLHKSGVQALTIKPGFVDTPMTADFEKGWMWTQPDDIARGIIKAIDRKKDVVYLPWFWKFIMFIIRSIPESIFKRLNL
jgi:short-subunit dehydrogenase